jgi:hypothetical protein
MNTMRKVIAFSVLVAIPMLLMSQPPDPPGGGVPPCGPPFGAVCPIDGGVSFLIAAGLALGGKKAYDLSRKRG